MMRALSHSASAPAGSLLPASDKTNWSIGSDNRQKQMYGNLYREKHRAEVKAQRRTGAAGGKKRIDTQPSPFLARALGMDPSNPLLDPALVLKFGSPKQ